VPASGRKQRVGLLVPLNSGDALAGSMQLFWKDEGDDDDGVFVCVCARVDPWSGVCAGCCWRQEYD
jgi:hypothetical protein